MKDSLAFCFSHSLLSFVSHVLTRKAISGMTLPKLRVSPICVLQLMSHINADAIVSGVVTKSSTIQT